jgi:hypothetical protein
MKLERKRRRPGSRRLTAGVVAAAGVLLSAIASCDALNPNLLGTVGVNATSTVDALPGNVVIVFINQTTFPARVNFSTVESGTIENLNLVSTRAASFTASAFICELAAITVTSVEVQQETTFGAIDFTEVALIGGVSFRCGSVVSIVLVGTPDNFEVSVRVD